MNLEKIEKLKRRVRFLARIGQQRKQDEEDRIENERRNLIYKKLQIITGAERYDHQLHSRLFTKY